MINRNLILPMGAALAIAACGETANGQSETAASSNASETAAQEGFAAKSGEYETDSKHRYITFSYLHQGYSRPYLRWRDWDATLNWNAEDPQASSVRVTIDASSVDSGVDEFDGHLKDERFFDVANHPEITFVSTSLDTVGEDAGSMTGDLTIKGVTKPVTLDVKLNRAAFDDVGQIYKLGFSAKGTVKRSDFGVDAYVPFVGDDVDVIIEAEFQMPAG